MRHLYAFAAVVLLSTCAAPAAVLPASPPPQASTPPPVEPVLAVLQTRHERLEVRMVDHVPRFTVYGDDGQVLARDLSPDALAKAYPALDETYRSGFGSLLADE